MRFHRVLFLAALLAPLAVQAQSKSFKIEPLKAAPPEAISAEIRAQLNPEGYRITTQDGKAFFEIWLRKSVPAKTKPAGPEAAVQFPFLSEGELLGAVRYAQEGFDYRDQSILPGVYTLRYGLQPINGDHLGVSPYRDFALLLPAAKDKTVASPDEKALERTSADAAGTNHPAVLLLWLVSEAPKTMPTMIHDREKETWGSILPFPLKVGDASAVTPYPIQLVVVGSAPL